MEQGGRKGFQIRNLGFLQADDDCGGWAYSILLALPRCSPWVLTTFPASLSVALQSPESLRPPSPLSSCPN